MANLSGSYLVVKMQRTEDEGSWWPAGKISTALCYRMQLGLPSPESFLFSACDSLVDVSANWFECCHSEFGFRASIDDSFVSETTFCQLARFAEGVFRAPCRHGAFLHAVFDWWPSYFSKLKQICSKFKSCSVYLFYTSMHLMLVLERGSSKSELHTSLQLAAVPLIPWGPYGIWDVAEWWSGCMECRPCFADDGFACVGDTLLPSGCSCNFLVVIMNYPILPMKYSFHIIRDAWLQASETTRAISLCCSTLK